MILNQTCSTLSPLLSDTFIHSALHHFYQLPNLYKKAKKTHHNLFKKCLELSFSQVPSGISFILCTLCWWVARTSCFGPPAATSSDLNLSDSSLSSRFSYCLQASCSYGSSAICICLFPPLVQKIVRLWLASLCWVTNTYSLPGFLLTKRSICTVWSTGKNGRKEAGKKERKATGEPYQTCVRVGSRAPACFRWWSVDFLKLQGDCVLFWTVVLGFDQASLLPESSVNFKFQLRSSYEALMLLLHFLSPNPCS